QVAIEGGLDLVADYIGQEIISTMCRARLTTQENGKVAPGRIGYAALDKMVELHLIAVPLDRGKEELLGVAHLGRGVAYVDTSGEVAPPVTRSVAAHEVAHALGFVSDKAEHVDRSSFAHCPDEDCIMHKNLFICTDTSHFGSSLAKFSALMSQSRLESAPQTVFSQIDFCKPCQTDMRQLGEAHIGALRTRRLFRSRTI
ncbi:MAG TPA: hypothetical protein VK712_01470, partial [Verrucomicrobiae bacterium]|nr:hypothetical protein [Verrucomicrobiae bacterium]